MDIRFYYKTIVLLALFWAAPLLAWADSQEPAWIVAGIDGGAWKNSDRDPSVRTAVKVGDAVRSSDRIETFQNNQVALAMDPRGQNMIAVRGAFRIEQAESGTRVQLERGRALAVLDDLKGPGDFSIVTPTGVAAVRGTRYTVLAPAAGMEVLTYRGEVLVSAAAKGTARRSAPSLALLKGQKTIFQEASKDALTASALSGRDWGEYEKSLGAIRSARKALRANGKQWFRESEAPERSRSVPAVPADGSGASKNGQTIVF